MIFGKGGVITRPMVSRFVAVTSWPRRAGHPRKHMGVTSMASDDQFNPPHVDDETPLDVARPLKAGIFARRFRQAAAQFRNPDLIPARSRLKSGRVNVQPLVCKLEEDCGRWIIQAHKCGLIPPAPKELVDFI